MIRYLSYRGFHIAAFRWNSAPVGLLLLAAVGVIYFFCELPTPLEDNFENLTCMVLQVWT